MSGHIPTDCRAYYNHPPDERLRQCTEERAWLLAVNAQLYEVLASFANAWDANMGRGLPVDVQRTLREHARAAISKAEGRP